MHDCREVVVQDEFNLRARGEQRYNEWCRVGDDGGGGEEAGFDEKPGGGGGEEAGFDEKPGWADKRIAVYYPMTRVVLCLGCWC